MGFDSVAPRVHVRGREKQPLHQHPATLSIRGDEAEEAWRVLTPVLDGWANDLVPIDEYPAGSDGPPPRANSS